MFDGKMKNAPFNLFNQILSGWNFDEKNVIFILDDSLTHGPDNSMGTLPKMETNEGWILEQKTQGQF